MGHVRFLSNKTLHRWSRRRKPYAVLWNIAKQTYTELCCFCWGFKHVHADRKMRECGKRKGGGLVVYINKRWCSLRSRSALMTLSFSSWGSFHMLLCLSCTFLCWPMQWQLVSCSTALWPTCRRSTCSPSCSSGLQSCLAFFNPSHFHPVCEVPHQGLQHAVYYSCKCKGYVLLSLSPCLAVPITT